MTSLKTWTFIYISLAVKEYTKSSAANLSEYFFILNLMMLSTGNIIYNIAGWKVKWKDVEAVVVSSKILSKYLPHGTASNNDEKIPVRIIFFFGKGHPIVLTIKWTYFNSQTQHTMYVAYNC